MRMTMKNKLFAITLLVLVVAAIILGVGVYGIRSLNASLERIGGSSQRSASLNMANEALLMLRYSGLQVITSDDADEIAKVVKEDFKTME